MATQQEKIRQVAELKALFRAKPEIGTMDAANITGLAESTACRIRREMGIKPPEKTRSDEMPLMTAVNQLLAQHWNQSLVIGG